MDTKADTVTNRIDALATLAQAELLSQTKSALLVIRSLVRENPKPPVTLCLTTSLPVCKQCSAYTDFLSLQRSLGGSN